MSAAVAIVVDNMRAEFAGEAKMAALVEEVEIVIGEEACGFMTAHRSWLPSLSTFEDGAERDTYAGEHC
jgi:hypothetical protein